MKKLFLFATLLVLSIGSAMAASGVNWDAYEWLGNGSGNEAYTNKIKVQKINQINIDNLQKPGFAKEPGIYVTTNSGIIECSISSDIQGAGIILHLSAFIYKETKVEITNATDGTFSFWVYYADGLDNPAEPGAEAVPSITAKAENITKNSAEINYTVTLPEALTGATVEVYVNDIVVSASPYAITGLDPSTSYTYEVYAKATFDDEPKESAHVIVTFKTLRDAIADDVYVNFTHLKLENAYLDGEDPAKDRRTFEADAQYKLSYTTDDKLVVEIDLANLPEVVGLVREVYTPSQKVLEKVGDTNIYRATCDGSYEYRAELQGAYFRFAYNGGAATAAITGYHFGDNEYHFCDDFGYTATAEATTGLASYTRTGLKADTWYALCLPFAVDANKFDEVVAYVGAGNDGESDYVEFEDVTGTLAAGTPYLFKVAADGDLTLEAENATLIAAPDEVTYPNDKFAFKGNFTTVEMDGKYGLSGGVFRKGNSNHTLKPFRAYLEGNGPQNVKIRFNGDTTGIEDLYIDTIDINGNIYNINGQNVDSRYKGIIIINGKKFYNK